MKTKQNALTIDRRPTTRRLLQWCLLPLLTVLVWVGGNQHATAADTNFVGTYTLVTIDGHKVPYTLTHEGASPTIKSGAFVLNTDGTCSSKMNFSLPAGGDSTREVKATYTRQGQKLTMQWAGAGTTTGTLQGDTFTMNNEGMVFVYRK